MNKVEEDQATSTMKVKQEYRDFVNEIKANDIDIVEF